MDARGAAREETRRRIVEATAKLHGERGVFGTSWRDIAAEADVSVGTVTLHFPSLGELLPACGALVMERAQPPRIEDAPAIIGEGADLRARFERMAVALFGYYERGGAHLEVDVRERTLPGMREWEESERKTVSAFVRQAASTDSIDAQTLQLVSALFDLATFKAFRTRGVTPAEAASTAARLAACLIEINE